MIYFCLTVLGMGALGVLGLVVVNAGCSVVFHAVMDHSRDRDRYLQAWVALLAGFLLMAPAAYAVYVVCYVPFCKG